ncbi:hypothetical protein VIGAN_06238200, partial [Vigna angularis var. angularis]
VSSVIFNEKAQIKINSYSRNISASLMIILIEKCWSVVVLDELSPWQNWYGNVLDHWRYFQMQYLLLVLLPHKIPYPKCTTATNNIRRFPHDLSFSGSAVLQRIF